MSRFILGFAFVTAFVLGSAFSREAAAHGPSGYGSSVRLHSHYHGHHHGHHHHQHVRPSYGGGYYIPGYYPAYPSYVYPRPQPRIGLYFGF